MYGMRFEFVWVLPTTGGLVPSFSRDRHGNNLGYDSCAIMGGVAGEGEEAIICSDVLS